MDGEVKSAKNINSVSLSWLEYFKHLEQHCFRYSDSQLSLYNNECKSRLNKSKTFKGLIQESLKSKLFVSVKSSAFQWLWSNKNPAVATFQKQQNPALCSQYVQFVTVTLKLQLWSFFSHVTFPLSHRNHSFPNVMDICLYQTSLLNKDFCSFIHETSESGSFFQIGLLKISEILRMENQNRLYGTAFVQK